MRAGRGGGGPRSRSRAARVQLQPAPEQALDRVYGDAAEAFDEVKPTAPAEIRPDVEAVTKGLHQLAELTAEAEEGPAQADHRRLVEVALSHQAAGDRVNAYNKERCGLDTAAATSP